VNRSKSPKNIIVPPLDVHAWATKEPREATVLQLVEKETEAWVTEFRANLADLETLVAQQKEAGRKAVEEIERAERTTAEGRKAQEKRRSPPKLDPPLSTSLEEGREDGL
jgi:hypothetical protein